MHPPFRSLARWIERMAIVIAAVFGADRPDARAQPVSDATPRTRTVDIHLVRDGLKELVKERIDADRFAEAIALLEQGVNVAADPANGEQATACEMLELLAALHEHSGDHGKALESSLLEFRLVCGLQQATFEQKANIFRNCEGRLARQGDTLRARTLCSMFLQACRDDPATKGPQQSLLIARALVQAAGLCVSVGLYDEADGYLREFWAIVEKAVKDENSAAVVMLLELGNRANLEQVRVDMARNDLANARRLAERNLEATRDHGGSDDEMADALMLVAEVCREQGDYDAALERLIAAGQMMTRRAEGRLKLGDADVQTGEELLSLERTSLAVARTLLESGQPDSARSFYIRALEYSRRRIGENVLAELDVLFGVGRCDIVRNNVAEAFDAFDIARRPFHDAMRRAAFSLGSGEHAELIAKVHSAIADAVEIAARSTDKPAAAEWGEEWLLNFKGIATTAQTRQQQLARARDRNSSSDDLFRLGVIRKQLSSVTLNRVNGEGDRSITAATKELLQEESLLVRKLALDRGLAGGRETWLAVDDVRRMMPSGATFIDIIRADSTTTLLQGGTTRGRYQAFIVPPEGKGDVTLIDLGEADAIDAAVASYREAIKAVETGGFKRGEYTVEEELKVTAAPLTSKVLQPIVEAVGDATEIVLSPDGSLWLVPWQALPLADGTYAIEKFAIRMVASGRDLVPVPLEANGARDGSVVVADPAFDRAPAASGKTSDDTSRSLAPSVELVRKFLPLKNTRTEALATKPAIAKLTGGEPKMLLGPEASEGNVKQAAVRPQTLVIATHGFFFPDQQRKRSDSLASLSGSPSRALSRAVTTTGEPLEDPLLRCGLALAGANVGAKTADGDDGLLTGAEIVGLDLLGTDLVVLSACETGVGKVHNGEGVAGLRQAFQIAGAKSVVATLWQVPDLESAQIMTAFYGHIAKGLPPSRALREAQLEFIKRRREDRNYEAAHPYLWAAYGVTGR